MQPLSTRIPGRLGVRKVPVVADGLTPLAVVRKKGLGLGQDRRTGGGAADVPASHGTRRYRERLLPQDL